jgi:AraC-like DNA-binding protein
MFEFKFHISQHKDFLALFAEQLGVELKGDLLILPDWLGEGYLRRVTLPNKLEAVLFDFTLNDDLWIIREKHDKEYYVFICQEVVNPGRVVTEVDHEKVETLIEEYAHMWLTSFMSDLRQFAPRGSSSRGTRVVISPEWMAGHLRIDKMEDVLHRYLQLNADAVHLKDMDFDSRQLFRELMDPPKDLHTDINAYLQNRITMILENFFSWLYQHMGEEKKKGISKEDVHKMIEVENHLLQDLTQAPSLDSLARLAAMSTTRLKTVFRQVFGLPPFAYFQQHRMLKAKDLLLESRLPVNEIGSRLGYRNMSNFILAFRKVFHVNPGELRSGSGKGKNNFSSKTQKNSDLHLRDKN